MIHLRIQELLEQNGKSKYWLTSKMGKSHRSISNLMKKDLTGIHFDTLENLCNIFNCEISDIVVRKKGRKRK